MSARKASDLLAFEFSPPRSLFPGCHTRRNLPRFGASRFAGREPSALISAQTSRCYNRGRHAFGGLQKANRVLTDSKAHRLQEPPKRDGKHRGKTFLTGKADRSIPTKYSDKSSRVALIYFPFGSLVLLYITRQSKTNTTTTPRSSRTAQRSKK